MFIEVIKSFKFKPGFELVPKTIEVDVD
jgi:hypothetical protein